MDKAFVTFRNISTIGSKNISFIAGMITGQVISTQNRTEIS